MQISNVDNEISAREDSSLVNIYAGKLFDSENERLLDHRVITISPQSGLIVDVQTYDPKHVDVGVDFSNTSNIDLRSLTVLPGFVDCHVHSKHPHSLIICYPINCSIIFCSSIPDSVPSSVF